MKEKRIALKPIEIHQICDCGGDMKFVGEVETGYPPKYPHKCEKCGIKATFGKVYPCIEYEVARKKKEQAE